MNLTELNSCLNPLVIYENSLVSGIFQILDACEDSKNLMVGIYLLEKNHFLYINRRFRNFIGVNNSKLLSEGWSYWFSIIDKNEATNVKSRVTDFLRTPYVQNSLSLCYHIKNFKNRRICLKHEVVLHKVKKYTLAINYLFDVSDKERIEHCFADNKVHDSSKRRLQVSPREKEILQLIASGFSSKEIADKLYISSHTAISHRKNLIRKFKVKNTAHLIKKAIEIIPL